MADERKAARELKFGTLGRWADISEDEIEADAQDLLDAPPDHDTDHDQDDD